MMANPRLCLTSKARRLRQADAALLAVVRCTERRAQLRARSTVLATNCPMMDVSEARAGRRKGLGLNNNLSPTRRSVSDIHIYHAVRFNPSKSEVITIHNPSTAMHVHNWLFKDRKEVHS